jgi:hypothetical protein
MDVADNDTLDMAGDWRVIYGSLNIFGGGCASATVDEQGHMMPHGYPNFTWVDRMRLALVGPGDHGGRKYKGASLIQPARIFQAETYYDHQGVQVVHMVGKLGGTIELHCGVHRHYPDNKGVHIVGSWCNTGQAFPADGINTGVSFHCQFVMEKPRRARK